MLDHPVCLVNRRTAPAAPDDNTSKRLTGPFLSQPKCQIVGVVGGQVHQARVLNLSAESIRFTLHAPLEPGSLLIVELSDRRDRLVCIALAWVIQVNLATNGASLIDCLFTDPLQLEAVHTLLA